MAEAYSGLGGFTGELLLALLDLRSESNIKYTVIIWADANAETESFYYRKLRQRQKDGACRVVSVPCPPISLRQHFCLSSFVDRLNGDIYFYPHFDLPLGVHLPSIAVIHDLAILKIRGYISKQSWLKTAYFKLMLRAVARKAKFIFAVSETTRRDFLAEVGQQFYGKMGVSLEAPIVRSLRTGSGHSLPFKVPDQFLLYVGVRRPHKNLKRIIDLFILLKENAAYAGTLLLVGSTENYDFDVERYIGPRSDIQIAGQVDDHTLTTLYQRMDALVFLSKYEGFGLPVVEAGHFGKKMIISDGGSLPEVAPPWAFILPNDTDLNRVVFKIKDYLENPVMFDESYKDKYAWHRVAERVQRQFDRVINSCPQKRHRYIE